MIRRLLCFLVIAAFAVVSRATDHLNVLLITADDLGLQLSCYGDPYIKTPNLDAFAASGVKFQTAYVTHASCSSSRSSMLSGLYPHTTGQIGLANAGFVLAEEEVGKNLMVYLKEAGYRNGILGKLHVAPESSFPLDYRPKGQDTRDVKAVAENAARFLNEKGEEPFFLMVNYSDPHFARDRETQKPIFPSQWKGLPPDPISEDTIPGWDFQGFDEPVARKRASNYYNTVKRLDIGIGLLLDELDRSGHRDNTLVIFLSDHGPPFSRGKTTCYESGLRVPFLVRWPGVSKAGIESEALVSTVDIVPTILDATRVAFPRQFHGKSLRSTVEKAEPPASWRSTLVGEFHFHGYQPFFPRRAIRDQRFKLIQNPLAGSSNPPIRVDGDPIVPFAEQAPHRDTPAGAAFRLYGDPPEWEFYDLETDPVEFHNRIDDPAHAERIKFLKNELQAWQEKTNDPIVTPEGIERMRKRGLDAKARDTASR